MALRSDERKQYELRKIGINFSLQGSADPSVTMRHGLIEVPVSVLGPREAKMRSHTIHDHANINVGVHIAAFSTGERKKRTRGDKRMLGFASIVKSTFEPVVQAHLYPRSRVDIFTQVIHRCASSGGVHSTSALLDLNTLEENDVPYIPVTAMPRTGRVTLATMDTRLYLDRFDNILRLAVDSSKVLCHEIWPSEHKSLVTAFGTGEKAGHAKEGEMDELK